MTSGAVVGTTERPRWLVPAVGVALILVPFVVGTFEVSLATTAVIFAVFAMSLDILVGYTGLISLGHAAFFGFGGYVAAYTSINLTGNLLVVMPIVLVTTALLAVVLGFLSLRTTGIYFLMITLAFGQMLFGLAVKWTPVTGGSDGLAGVPAAFIGVGPFEFLFAGRVPFYYLVVAAFFVLWWFLARVVGSPFGHALVGIKDNEERLASLGYNTWRYKMAAYVLAGSVAGLAGALFVFFNRHAAPENLFWVVSGEVLLMVIIGGAGTLYGPALGAVLVRLFGSYVSS
ncbi:Branched-chain amino acid transport system permease protein LivM (TC 3.A.1.4.1), partial [hydrothermal vent metagenome]